MGGRGTLGATHMLTVLLGGWLHRHIHVSKLITPHALNSEFLVYQLQPVKDSECAVPSPDSPGWGWDK